MCILLALTLTGCGMALGAATEKPETKKLVTSSGNGIANVGKYDFDGDGQYDDVLLTFNNPKKPPYDAYATLEVSLADGRHVTHTIEGYWREKGYTLNCADLTYDGRDELVLFLISTMPEITTVERCLFCH